MSYQRGVIFVGNRYLAGAEDWGKTSTSWAEPLTVKAMMKVSLKVYKAMPVWYHLLSVSALFASMIPWMAGWYQPGEWIGFPVYLWGYFFLGTHFWFPEEMKRYHGAEHKVFSSDELISVRNIKIINDAEITNRYCSTNVIVLYFIQLPIILMAILLLTSAPFFHQLEWSTYLNLLLLPFSLKWLNRSVRGRRLRNGILTLSYAAQRHVTTLEPNEKHLKTAVKAYRRVLLKESPGRLKQERPFGKPKKRNKKEESKMAIADITIVPLGSGSTSVSEVVASVHQLLKDTELPIQYELTPMSTIIEGKPEDLYDIIRQVHEVPFKHGHQRIALNIRIDDRRDKESGMALKLKAVNERLNE
ncbi:MTH1187 family thiamine-binding protein [Salisediminibacterium beveridgei]|nr:MTH1187 family thiamine-binding protein [Salisediminibacterium beveridgei]